jgi:Tn3 transposase DDE domain
MAKQMGLSQSTVSRIWRAFGLQPHRSEAFKLSTDPYFVDKVHDVLGLYLDPPERALVYGMEDQLGSLGLVLNAVVLWTTRYIDAAVAQRRAEGHEIRNEDIARLSPLKHKNLNVFGRYTFTLSVPAGGLRPLRDPDAAGLDDDESDDGAED